MARRTWDWSWQRYTAARPLEATDGIRARSRRGRIGDTWWSQRFVDVLESFRMGARLTRGRRYARSGQVMDLEVTPGRVTAKVQGTRRTPYAVRIAVRTLPEEDWARVEARLAAEAVHLARLLAGEMPPDVEDAFAACSLSLFPASTRELTTSCSCPDWANPCKHLAATYYILAERFDEDPFLVFAWRGRPREALLDRLRAQRCAVTGADTGDAFQAGAGLEAGRPLGEDLERFWLPGADLSDLVAEPRKAEVPDVALQELGPLPAAARDAAAALSEAYAAMVARAVERAYEGRGGRAL